MECSSGPVSVLRPPTVLLVEDDELLRETVAEFLLELSYDVVEAVDGDQARDLLLGGVPVDVVFSDVRMPGQTDGFALAAWIRTNRPGLGVLLTSGYTGEMQRAEQAPNGPSLLPKPYRQQDLASRLSVLISQLDD